MKMNSTTLLVAFLTVGCAGSSAASGTVSKPSTPSAAEGTCICRTADGSSYRYCVDSLTACMQLCQKQSQQPSYASGGCKRPRIQECELAKLAELGYTSGNKHEFCLRAGWGGGQIPSGSEGTCFRPLNGNTLTDCPRLHHYYHKSGGFTCQHLTENDASVLRVCGHE